MTTDPSSSSKPLMVNSFKTVSNLTLGIVNDILTSRIIKWKSRRNRKKACENVPLARIWILCDERNKRSLEKVENKLVHIRSYFLV